MRKLITLSLFLLILLPKYILANPLLPKSFIQVKMEVESQLSTDGMPIVTISLDGKNLPAKNVAVNFDLVTIDSIPNRKTTVIDPGRCNLSKDGNSCNLSATNPFTQVKFKLDTKAPYIKSEFRSADETVEIEKNPPALPVPFDLRQGAAIVSLGNISGFVECGFDPQNYY